MKHREPQGIGRVRVTVALRCSVDTKVNLVKDDLRVHSRALGQLPQAEFPRAGPGKSTEFRIYGGPI
jgi:hypothetical protein